VFIAAAAIVTSCVMPAMGVFWGSIAQSLMAKGIGDLFKAAVAVITNNPINLKAYLKSSAMSMGIAVVTSGALFFIDKAFGGLQMLDGIAGRARDKFGNMVLNEAGEVAYSAATISAKLMGALEIAKYQAGTIATTAAFYDLGRKTIDQEDIKHQAHDAGQEIVNEQASNLKKIYSSGKLGDLFKTIETITKDAAERFNSDATQFISGTVTSTLSYLTTGLPAADSYGGLYGVASDLGRAALRQAKALPTIKQKTIAAIVDLATKSSSKLDLLKTRIIELFTTEATQILNLLTTQGYTSADIVCSSLGNLDTSSANLSHPQSSYIEGLINSCNAIELAIQNIDYSVFIDRFTAIASGTVIHIQKDIVDLFAQGAAIPLVSLVCYVSI